MTARFSSLAARSKRPRARTRWRFVVAPGLMLLLVGVWLSASMSCSGLPQPPVCIPCESTCPGDLRCNTLARQCVPKDDPHACDEVPASGAGGQGGTGAGGSGESPGGVAGEASSGTDSAGGDNSDTGGGEAGAGGAGAGSATRCSEGCKACILTERDLDAVCTGTDLSIQFDARWTCDPPGTPREMVWELNAPDPGLVMSNDGVLSGWVPDGVYEFEVEVFISKQYHASEWFTLTVQNQCRLLFLTDDTGDETVRVAAARLDSDDAVVLLPRSDDGKGSVTSFTVTQNGRFVAQTVQSELETRLELVELGPSDESARALDYDGSYAAHAFSNDSRWLAIVTTSADGADQELLQLFDLSDGGLLADSKGIDYESHLTWSDTSTILYLGWASIDPLHALAAQEQTVEASQLVERHEQPGTTLREDETFYGFLIGDAGYLNVYDQRVTYVDRTQSDWFEQPLAAAISPNLKWSAHSHGEAAMRVDPLTLRWSPYEPFSVASSCEIIRAFSGDGSRFLCTSQQRFLVYRTRDTLGSLSYDELDVPGGFQSDVPRMTFSERGNWLALVPNQKGMILASADGYASEVFDAPLLGEPVGEFDWDFLFSPDEKWLVVQHVAGVLVARLHGPDPPELVPVADDVNLPPVPGCSYNTATDPDAWCGAPRFRGNLLMSRAGLHVAFADDAGVVHAVDLETKRTIRAGTLAQACLPSGATRCIQFQ